MRSKRASSRSACSRTSSGISASAIFVAVLLDDRAPRPRRAPCGSSPSACAGCTRAAASRRRCSTSSRMRRRTCISASRSRWSSRASSSRSTHVDGLEQLDLLLEGEVGRVAGRCRRARRARRSSARRRRCGRRRRAARGSPRRRRGTRSRARGRLRRPDVSSGRSSTSTKRRPCASVSAAPAIAAVEAVQRDGGPPPGSRTRSVDLGDGADLRVLAVVLRARAARAPRRRRRRSA